MEEIKEIKDMSIKDKIDTLYDTVIKEDKKKKDKKLRLPRRAKVSKRRSKRGYCGVLFVNETGNISGQKTKLEGGTYDTKDKNIHYTDGHEIMFWDGKFPVLWQRHDKLNPTNLFPKAGDKNEIYGQEYVKLRIKKDVIKDVKKAGGMSIIIMIAVVVGGYFLIKMLFPKLFGG